MESLYNVYIVKSRIPPQFFFLKNRQLNVSCLTRPPRLMTRKFAPCYCGGRPDSGGTPEERLHLDGHVSECVRCYGLSRIAIEAGYIHAGVVAHDDRAPTHRGAGYLLGFAILIRNRAGRHDKSLFSRDKRAFEMCVVFRVPDSLAQESGYKVITDCPVTVPENTCGEAFSLRGIA